MKRRYSIILAAALVMPFSMCFAQEFPAAPPKLKEMEAQGLLRVSAEDLKAHFPGIVDWKGVTSRRIITHNPDGSLVSKGFKHGFADILGKWRIDEKNNTYCKALPKQRGGIEEHCFAVFRASDGVHFFDYDVKDGLYVGVWRKSSDQ
jgi:hypothetical protein